jgi:hypothetical protein
MILLLVFLSMVGTPEGLTGNIHLYWDALQTGDKARALQYVHPADLNNFINRREARFESWELLQVDLKSETEAEVKIQLQRFLPNGVVGPVKGRETWVRTEEGWKIRVEAAGRQYQQAMGGGRKSQEEDKSASLPERLQISPKVLNFYAIFPDQPRLLHILNGLDKPVDSLEIEIDPEKFEILLRPDQVQARSKGLIKFRYQGDEEGENLKDQVVLRIEQGGKLQEFTIPIVYNYMDEASRWLMQVEGERRQKP